MKFEITSRWNGAVLFSKETTSLKSAVVAAVKDGANLRGANLGEADLYGADLRGANLGEADLYGADLGGANLGEADLSGANLRGADLYGADLYGADLRGANLRGADLSGANLGEANLRGANLSEADLGEADLGGANLRGTDLRRTDLRGADLRGANLTSIRDDIWAVLSCAPAEVIGLRQAILDGKIDGNSYEGSCACLVGTLANVKRCKYNDMEAMEALTPDNSRPAERFFFAIKPGDTPQNSQFAKLALEWVDQWLSNMRSAFSQVLSEGADTDRYKDCERK